MKIHKQVFWYKPYQKLKYGEEITALIAYGTREWELNDKTVFNVTHSLYVNLWFVKLVFHWDKVTPTKTDKTTEV